MAHHFKDIVGDTDLPESVFTKERGLRSILEENDWEPGHVIYVANSPNDLEAARKVGVIPVGFAATEGDAEKLRALEPNHIVHEDFLFADSIVEGILAGERMALRLTPFAQDHGEQGRQRRPRRTMAEKALPDFPRPVGEDEHLWNFAMSLSPYFSYLNRHSYQMDDFRERILPLLVKRHEADKRLRFAVMGSATGEEPATLLAAVQFAKQFMKHGFEMAITDVGDDE